MKRFSKSLFMIFILMILMLIPAQPSMAASKYPGRVTKLKAKILTDTSVQLSWSKASGATGYTVYSVDPETGAQKKIGSTKTTSCIVKKLRVEQQYKYQVYAYKKVGKKTYKSKQPSNAVSVKTQMSVPGKIKNFRFVCYGDSSIFLAWDESKNADDYVLYQYNWETSTYEQIAVTDETSYHVKKLVAGERYYFKVQAVHRLQGKETIGKLSAKVGATAKEIDVASIHGRYRSATLKKNTTVTVKSTGKKMTLKKGTTVTATKSGSGNITALLKNGTRVTVKGSKLSYGNLVTSSTKYSKAQKEAFVNGRGYTSKTNYLIWVSQYTLETNVFKGSKGAWKLVRTMKCVVGKDGHTPQGRFAILSRVGRLNGMPAYYFTWNSRLGGGNAFHCRINGKASGAYSNGCIRLGSSDLSYIGKYCKPGTTVISY